MNRIYDVDHFGLSAETRMDYAQMTQFSLRAGVSSAIRGQRHSRHVEEKYRFELLSPQVALLLAMSRDCLKGGGDVTVDALAESHGLFVTEVQLQELLDSLCADGLISIANRADEAAADGAQEIVEYEVSPRGLRIAIELESLLSSRMARD